MPEQPEDQGRVSDRARVYRRVVATLANGLLEKGWTDEAESLWAAIENQAPKESDR